MSIYLASNSPRRRELLHQIHVRHEVLLFRGPGREDHDINEDAFTYVQRVARAKAEGGIQRMHWRGLPQQLLLAADTTLELDGEIIGKPASPTGIITVAQIPAAIQALQAAVAAEDERSKQPAEAIDKDAEDEDGKDVKATVGLKQRAVPFIDMLQRSAAAPVTDPVSALSPA